MNGKPIGEVRDMTDTTGLIFYADLYVDPESGVVFRKNGAKIFFINLKGYLIAKVGRTYHKPCHRVVWESVNGPLPQGKVINHINGIKTDNRISNLEAVTPAENNLHAHRTGLTCNAGSRNGHAILTEDQVIAIRQSKEPCKALANKYGVARPTIIAVQRRDTWRHIP